MANNFIWTYASWDKIRPKLLPSTGLGEALKVYEKTKVELEKLDTDGFIDPFAKAVSALEKVDKVRELAIKKCGNNPLFKTCKNALEAAKVAEERLALSNVLGMCLTKLLNEVKQPLTKAIIELKGRQETAEKTLKNLKVLVNKANAEAQAKAKLEGVNLEPKFLKKFFREFPISLPTDQMNLAKSVTNKENNFLANQKYPAVIVRCESQVKAKWALLTKNAPKPVMAKWEEVIKAIEQFQNLNLAYGQQIKEIHQLYKPFSID